MNELSTPRVPELGDEWMAARTQHLVDEVATPTRRRSRRYALTGFGGGTVALAALLVGLLGPWTTPAFAGWSPQPTAPSSDQLGTAETACTQLASNLASVSNDTDLASLAPIALSDVRGPYTLIVYGTSDPSLCVAGTGLTSLHESGGAISIGSSAVSDTGVHSGGSWASSSNETSNTSVPTSDGAVVNLAYTDNQSDQFFSVAEGSVGAQVSGVSLTLSDGSSVVATVENGLFAAWWPGQATVSSIQVTTSAASN
jgi:mannose-6-phosphate isomerase-like protein (cupin superfamily)